MSTELTDLPPRDEFVIEHYEPGVGEWWECNAHDAIKDFESAVRIATAWSKSEEVRQERHKQYRVMRCRITYDIVWESPRGQ